MHMHTHSTLYLILSLFLPLCPLAVATAAEDNFHCSVPFISIEKQVTIIKVATTSKQHSVETNSCSTTTNTTRTIDTDDKRSV